MKAIHVLRKPCSGSTVVANVLKHGCGAINVDGCRVGADRVDTRHGGGNHSDHINQLDPDAKGYVLPAGRWPANVVFQHLPVCRQTGIRSVAGTGHFPIARTPNTIYGGGAGTSTAQVGGERRIGKETIPRYDCKDGCPVAALDAQSGVSTSTGGRASIGAFKGGRAFGVGNGAEVLPGVQPGLGDTGGASRFFKQFGGKPE